MIVTCLSVDFENFKTKENNREVSLLLSPIMESSSPLSYVFPSFRGPDVRRTFLSHLLVEFNRKGINTFNDNGIKRGESIDPALVRAIRESRICIIIISRNYASSSWTLNELVEIMECKRTSGKMVMTVFYEVDPSHVRKQSGEFGKAYRNTCKKKTEQVKQRWKEALTNVANILGEHSHNWDNEADMVSKIATDVSNELNFTPSRDFNNLVGIEAHIAKMESLLCLESHETRMVGIWGPVGIGKTTIARVIYSLISGCFQRSVFMENVKTSYRSGGSDSRYSLMLRLQKKFLSKILDHKGLKISHLRAAEDRLKFLKVLVVLDDVDKLEQLHALAEGPHWFGKGSRIIVTTEDKQILKAHKIQHIYEMNFPSSDEALKIFSQSAFGQNFPRKGYEEFAVEVRELTSQLPLGLCVLGNALRGKSVSEWTDELPRIKTSLNRDVEQVLSGCYNGLDDKDKAIFLYIACLFEDKTVDSVMQLLANSGLDIKYGLNVLVERALISILSDKTIIMHNLLRQMGREIVRRHSIRLPRRCQFWIAARDMYDVIADHTGLASENAINGMHHQFLRFYRTLMDKGRKLKKLWDGIKVLVFLRLSLFVFSMFWLLKFGFLSIMSMFPPAFAKIRFGISRRLVSAFP